MSKRKKYPITQKVAVTVSGRRCNTIDDVRIAELDAESEFLTGRIHFIVRNVAKDGHLDVRGLGLTVWGADIAALEIDVNDERSLNFVSDGPYSDELIQEHCSEPLDIEDLEHICFVLEEKYVVRWARFCKIDPYDDAVGNGMSAFGDMEMPDSPEVCVAMRAIMEPFFAVFDGGEFPKAEDVIGGILDSAARAVSICDDPDILLRQFQERVHEEIIKVRRGDALSPVSGKEVVS